MKKETTVMKSAVTKKGSIRSIVVSTSATKGKMKKNRTALISQREAPVAVLLGSPKTMKKGVTTPRRMRKKGSIHEAVSIQPKSSVKKSQVRKRPRK